MDGAIADGGTLVFAQFTLDPAARTLRHGETPVVLTPTVFNTLLYLVENAGRVVTKDELIAAVWPWRTIGESTLSQTIFTLRRALVAAGAQEPLIATASGKGYRFAAPVRIEPRDRPVPPPAGPLAPDHPAAPAPESAPAPTRAMNWPMLAAAAVLVAVVAIGWWAVRRPAPAAGPPLVLVQARFQNQTGDHAFDVALGRVVEVDLGQSPSLSVLTAQQVADTLRQMMRQGDETLTPVLAGQVCRRNDGRAVIEGALASPGGRYLLTLTATDCQDGRRLSAQKAVVDRRDQVIPALDRLIDRTRRTLGESAASLKRYDTPLLHGRTASLEALQAYSEGMRAADHGQSQDAITLLEHAVALDPRFAAAHFELARQDFNARRYAESRVEITRAYRLRDTVGDDLRYSIEIIDVLIMELDYPKALALAKAATDAFPDHAVGWAQQANLDMQLGLFKDAVVAARREVSLTPGREAARYRLVTALMNDDQLEAARAAASDAAAHGASGALIASALDELAVATGDDRALRRNLAAAGGRPWEADVLIDAGRAAYEKGEVRQGDLLFARAGGLYRAAGEDGYYVGHQAIALALLGEDRAASRLVSPVPDDHGVTSLSVIYALFTLAETGQADRAHTLLDRLLRRGPTDTILNAEFAPEARAALALRQGRPEAGLAMLAPASLYEARDNGVPYLRGRIYLALGDGAQAAREFHKIVDHPGRDPLDVRHRLAHLGLARALRLAGDRVGARREYQSLLAGWSDADADVPVITTARREAAAL